jgi:transcriptional regulator with XRE-family HTH domain
VSTTLRIVRVAGGMRQQDLAAAAGVCREEVSRLESGRHRPQLATAEALSRVLGVSPALLFPPPAAEPRHDKEISAV